MKLGETQPFVSPEEAVSVITKADKWGTPIEHYGTKGMRWGVRKDDSASGLLKSEVPGVPAKTDRKAKKDAEEFTKAKLYFGQGAGTRRKLIKAKVEAESKKDPLYKKSFDHHVAKTDFAKRAKQAQKTRKRTDRKESIKKNARKSGLNDYLRDQAVRTVLEQGALTPEHQAAVARVDALAMLGAEFMAHHGVKGMKWGVRKEDKTSGDSTVGVDPVTVALVTVYSAMAIKVAIAAHRYKKDGGEHIAEQNKDVVWKKDPKLAKKMSADELHKNVVKQVNPDFPKAGTKMNCRRCTLTYEMRRRGYDVESTKSRFAKGQDDAGLKAALGKKDAKHESWWGEKQIATPETMFKSKPDERGQHIFDALNKQPDGARGELGVGWFPMGGHSMAWEKVDGQAHIFDTQSGKKYSTPKSMREMTEVMHDAAYTRTDTAKLDDQFIRRWMVNAR